MTERDGQPPRLRELLHEDWRTHHRSFGMPGLHALVLYRIAVWGRRQPAPLRLLVAVAYRVLNTALIRNVYGIEIWKTTVIGRRLLIAHHQGVVLGHAAVLGDDCLVRQNVTLGAKRDERIDDMPRVGDRVHFGAGATVVGAVTIGDDARIGPGVVITRDVPAGAVALPPPADLRLPGAG